MIATVDESRLDALRRDYAERMQKAGPASRYKYLDVVFHTLQKLLLARELGLHKGPPRRVLDIGTGGGHLPLVCRFHGHQAVGIDVKDAFYACLAACLGVQRTVVRVEAQTPLPDLGGRFDVITACDIAFNEKREGKTRGLYWSAVLALAARNGAAVSRWRRTIRFTVAALREIR